MNERIDAPMREVRCPTCNHLLFYADSLSKPYIEIKCSSCKHIIAVNGENQVVKVVTKRVAE